MFECDEHDDVPADDSSCICSKAIVEGHDSFVFDSVDNDEPNGLFLVHDSCLDEVDWLTNNCSKEACQEAAREVAPDIVLHDPMLQKGLFHLVVGC